LSKKQRTTHAKNIATVERLLSEVDRARSELRNRQTQPNLPPAHESLSPIAVLSKAVEEAQVAQTVGTELKELYNYIAKLGKDIDKYFPADPAAALNIEPSFEPAQLRLAIIKHLYSKGRFKAAEEYVRISGYTPPVGMKEQYQQLHFVCTELRAGNMAPALQWTRERRSDPQISFSGLEFALLRANFIHLLFAGRRMEAVTFARAHFASFASTESKQIQRLMGALAFGARLERSPYNGLAQEAAQCIANFYKVSGLHTHRMALEYCVQAGWATLPAQLRLATVLQRLPLPPPELSSELHFHSLFACPVSREHSTADNPPMLLHCGHVIAKASMLKLARGGSSRFKCPYCPIEQTVGQAHAIIF